MRPRDVTELPMDPTELRQLLHDRAQQVKVHGDFAPAAIAGARRVHAQRAVTAGVAAVLAVAIPFAISSRDPGQSPDRPATNTATLAPAPTPVTAVARVGPPLGPMPLPYIQAGLLHLGGRTVSIPDLRDRRLLLFATLRGGGVVYQVAGPDPALPTLDTGPLTFLDPDGQVVRQQPSVAQADADGRGDRVTAVAESGEFVVFDVNGAVLRRMAAMGAFQATSRAAELGPDLVANLAGIDNRVGSLSTGRSAYIATGVGRTSTGEGDPLTLHDERTLIVDGIVEPTRGGTGCKYLSNYLTGEQVRSWCDDTRPIGFSPDGAWMYGEYRGRPGWWVERTDDGARLLEIETDEATGDRFSGEFAAPSPDGSALLVVVAAEDGQTVTTSCAIATGSCEVVSDGLDAPSRGLLSLPDNYGRQQDSNN
ncbi:MAG TPA: hypothetical protein VJN29_19210 [Intrasporangium sp.]|uniref:hypothetical protein n=1 Tax=Intrasporangium sp. TaxID=1925024 RepID=UPI002B48CC9C|nr:hypothetical protein [Intrasporangium sp.]HKX69350.1 hypothetical protein [Intrasporangium sp.]